MDLGLIVVWLLVTAVLWAIGVPITSVLFPSAPDRGFSFSLPIVITLFTLIAYWIGQHTFSLTGLIFSLFLITGCALVATRYSPGIPWNRCLESGLVFLVAFLFMLLIRAADPGIYPSGGEKFLDFALLQTVTRASTLPPIDPWFATEPVRYYYGGHLLGATLTELTTTPPRIAYNLLVPWFYATLATATYGLAGWLAHTKNHRYRTGGTLGVLMVGFAGNLATPARMTLQFLPRDITHTVGPVLLGAIRDPYPALIDQYAAGEFFAWNARYVIPNTPNVFPMWTFTNGDLRPHMMSAPLLVFAMALLYHYYTVSTEHQTRRYRPLGAFILVTGALALVHTWALPTLWGLLILTLLFAPSHPSTLLPHTLRARLSSIRAARHHETNSLDPTRWAAALVLSTSTLVAGALLVVPHLLWHTPIHQGIGFFPPRSNLGGLLLVYGAFIGLFLLYYRPHSLASSLNLSRTTTVLAALAILSLLTILVLVWNLAALAIFAPLLVLAWYHHYSSDARGFETVLVIAGIGLLLIAEFTYAQVYPHDPRAPRWNTVYKVSHQTWIIWGLATAPIITTLLNRAHSTTRNTTKRVTNRFKHFNYAQIAIVIAIVLVVLSMTFGILVTAQHVSLLDTAAEQDRITLNGTAYVQVEHPGEAGAIRWLQSQEGQPTMVSQPTRLPYRWGNGRGASAGASLSGIPTVVGWSHEIGYRGEPAVEHRATAVDRLYTGNTTTTIKVLKKYKVDLIYMGPHERITYGQRDFSTLPGITIAHYSGTVTIYHVNHTQLDPPD